MKQLLTKYRSILLFLLILPSVIGCAGKSKGEAQNGFPFNSTAAKNISNEDQSDMKKIDLPKMRVNAPEFPKEFAWVNTDRPLAIKEDLKGCVVVLDFWTYCCINCMHILPDLEFIEHKYAGKPVVVIGVHSAKFDNESDEQNINSACSRYNIAHPVIVDEGHDIWSEYGVRSWPTLMVIDPEGKVVGSLSGEGNRETLDAVVYSLLEEGKEKGTLASTAPEIKRKARVPAASGLAFPGKVLADKNGKYLFISDSNHDRVIVSDYSGNVISVAGSGKKGQSDGDFMKAEFNNPQGLAYDDVSDILYVADTDNHLIRKLDLNAKTVKTIAGTGEQVYDREGGKIGIDQGLNSPWDLVLHDNMLYIAMAGPHQLWVMDLKTNEVKNWVGSGREDIVDGIGTRAALAQPSGIVKKGDWLYFVDSEVSALRRVNLQSKKVESLIGSGLFDFGDKDGNFSSALLQHPLGITVDGDDIIVADTYNHKIKRANESIHKIMTITGSGKPLEIAPSEGELNLYEPGGISIYRDNLYIADTNHDRIIEYNLPSENWEEFKLKGLYLEASRRKEKEMANVEVKEVSIKPGADLTLRLSADFLRGTHLNKDAPISYTFMTEKPNGIQSIEGLSNKNMIPVEIKIPAASLRNGETYSTTLNFAYCTDGDMGLCVPVTLGWKLRLTEDPMAVNVVELSDRVQPIQ